jgi:hypothetical protein
MESKDNDIKLPVIDQDEEAETGAACDPKVYVSLEEKTVLDAMRSLRLRAQELKSRIESESGSRRSGLEAELEELRRQRKELQTRREKAYKRKMIMLGHLPPGDIELL